MSLPVMTVTGNACGDPELRYTASGVAVAKFTVAASDRKRQEDGTWADGETAYVTVNVWREQAEAVCESITKGTRVVVVGRLRQRSYETKAGEKRTVFELEADEVAPSLKFASAKVSRSSRSGGDRFQGTDRPASGPAEDPWASEAPF